jgi:ribosome recycling factor
MLPIIEPIVTDLKKRMDGALHNLQHSLNGLRTGRASAALLEPIKVEAYGDMLPISQLGTISVPEPRMIVVQVWDREVAKAVDKAIAAAGLGLSPITEGQVIRVPLPDLSEERRKELTKKARDYAEQGKIAIRNVRRDGMDALKKLEKNKELSEDDSKTASNDIQKVTDEYVKKADVLCNTKCDEIMGHL